MSLSDLDYELLCQDVYDAMLGNVARAPSYQLAPKPLRKLTRKMVNTVLAAIGDQMS